MPTRSTKRQFSSNAEFYAFIDSIADRLRSGGFGHDSERLNTLVHKVAWTTSSELFGDLRIALRKILEERPSLDPIVLLDIAVAIDAIERMPHVQQTFLQLGDEFLIQYFICAHKAFRSNQILSRLFSMGHSLELYAKAALVSSAGFYPVGHDVASLIAQYDATLALSPEEVAAGEALFGSELTTIDLGFLSMHQLAMELYVRRVFLERREVAISGRMGGPFFQLRCP